MQRLRAGDLRERIVFLTPVRVGDRGFATISYSTAFVVWAAAHLKGGSIDMAQNRGAPKLAVDFEVRYRSDITNDMKVIWRGMTFEIGSPFQLVPTEGRLTIPCLQESVSLSVDHFTITPNPATVAPSATLQLVVNAFDIAGNALPGRLATWVSSDPTIASVDSQTGIVTGVAFGACIITATCEGKTATTSLTTGDGSNAEVLAVIGSSHILSFWDVATNLTLGDGSTSGGVKQIDDARGVGVGPPLLGVQDSGGTFWLPNYDSTAKSARTNTGGITALVTAWGGNALYDLSQIRTLVWFGRSRAVSAGSKCCGIQNIASPSTINFALAGDFVAGAAQGVQPKLTNGGETHTWADDTAAAGGGFGNSTLLANAEAAPRGIVVTLPQPTGANHSLQATPQATIEKLGRLRRMLIQSSPNDNVFTVFPSAAGRVYFGGEPFGANGLNNCDIEFYGGLVIDKVLTRAELAALERWAVRRGCSLDTSVPHGVVCVGDSRTYGNGASDASHTWPGVLQIALGSGYDVDNRGVSGDGFANAIDSNILSQRLGYDRDTHRSWDWCVIWEGVNSFNLSMTAATALADLDILIAAAKADGKKVCVCHETGQISGIPQAAAYNTGIDARLASGAIDAVALIETGTDVMDFADTNDYVDGLHPTNAVYAQIGTIVKNTIIAAGG